MTTVRARLPLLLVVFVTLLLALLGGLVRIGWPWPTPQPSLVALHGPLMVCGFLGTLIALERAVALNRAWAYGIPALAALGALVTLAGGPPLLGAALAALASFLLLFVFIAPREPLALHGATMMLGVWAWLAGNLVWLVGRPIPHAVPWWAAFLTLTIAGERLELSRVLRLRPAQESLFLAVVAVQLVGLALSLAWFDGGVRLFGLGVLLLALWLARYDLARRTVRLKGLTRFIAAALLAGYGWLAVAGVVALTYGGVTAGFIYDAWLHALFVGFVFSMIFGHAPVILPAVLRVPLGYSPVFYVPLALLHASVALRVVGDLLVLDAVRRDGALLNGLAILLFLGLAVWATARARVAQRRGREALSNPPANATIAGRDMVKPETRPYGR